MTAMTTPRRRTAAISSIAVALLAGGLLAACGDDDEGAADTTIAVLARGDRGPGAHRGPQPWRAPRHRRGRVESAAAAAESTVESEVATAESAAASAESSVESEVAGDRVRGRIPSRPRSSPRSPRSSPRSPRWRPRPRPESSGPETSGPATSGSATSASTTIGPETSRPETSGPATSLGATESGAPSSSLLADACADSAALRASIAELTSFDISIQRLPAVGGAAGGGQGRLGDAAHVRRNRPPAVDRRSRRVDRRPADRVRRRRRIGAIGSAFGDVIDNAQALVQQIGDACPTTSSSIPSSTTETSLSD